MRLNSGSQHSFYFRKKSTELFMSQMFSSFITWGSNQQNAGIGRHFGTNSSLTYTGKEPCICSRRHSPSTLLGLLYSQLKILGHTCLPRGEGRPRGLDLEGKELSEVVCPVDCVFAEAPKQTASKLLYQVLSLLTKF